MRIAVDMDEVLFDFVGRILRRWNAINGTAFKKEDVNVWRMEEVLKFDRHGRSAEGLIDEWMREPDFFTDLDPLPGAIAGFNELRKEHDVIVVTSIPEIASGVFDGKRKCMRRNFPDYSMKNVIACSRKGCIDADVLVDDGEHNISDFTEAGGDGIVFDAAWNRDLKKYKYPHLVHRAYDWEGVVRIIKEHL